jgi:hypothetical protein
MHTHVGLSIYDLNNDESAFGHTQTTKEPGASEDDVISADKLKASVYAMAMYKDEDTGVKGNIYKVDINGNGKDSITPISNFYDVINSNFNILRYVVKSNVRKIR